MGRKAQCARKKLCMLLCGGNWHWKDSPGLPATNRRSSSINFLICILLSLHDPFMLALVLSSLFPAELHLNPLETSLTQFKSAQLQFISLRPVKKFLVDIYAILFQSKTHFYYYLKFVDAFQLQKLLHFTERIFSTSSLPTNPFWNGPSFSIIHLHEY